MLPCHLLSPSLRRICAVVSLKSLTPPKVSHWKTTKIKRLGLASQNLDNSGVTILGNPLRHQVLLQVWPRFCKKPWSFHSVRGMNLFTLLPPRLMFTSRSAAAFTKVLGYSQRWKDEEGREIFLLSCVRRRELGLLFSKNILIHHLSSFSAPLWSRRTFSAFIYSNAAQSVAHRLHLVIW